MKPNKSQMSEGEKLERANNTLLPFLGKGHPKQKEAKELFERNISEHGTRTVKDVKKLPKDDIIEANAEAIGRMRRGEPSLYRTSKDLSK